MTGGLSLEERVARHLEHQNPDAGVPELAGALSVSPGEIVAVLDEDLDVDGEEPAREEDTSEESQDGVHYKSLNRGVLSAWATAEWDDVDAGVWPPEWLDREQWMGHVEKKPFAPWGDRDAPAPCNKDGHDTADVCDCDARYKWGYQEHYVDSETVAMAEIDPQLDGRAFIQQPDDPYVYVDGDDVRDPDTDEVHPAFLAFLEHLGLTYADISTSGAGVHAIYRGSLREDVKQASWQLDADPWGSNEELPSIEIYPGKRVCVATGDHVPGTPTEIHEWNADVLPALLEANDQVTSSSRDGGDRPAPTRDDYDLDDYEPTVTSGDETTADIRDVFAAIDRLDARAVAEQTIVHRWNDDASTSEGYRAFVPTWGRNSNGTANIVDDQLWQDTGDEAGYGGPVVMALIDAGELSHRNVRPQDARGQVWWRGVEHLRDLGFPIPELDAPSEDAVDDDEDLHPLLEAALKQDDVDVDGQPTSTLPLGQLEAMTPDDRRRAAQQRGLDWPTTEEAREELFATITEVMAEEDDQIVDAPTALGKSHTVATTPWTSDQYHSVTGGQPVIHLLPTRDARDDAAQSANEAGVDYYRLESRHEACPVAAGDHDPEQCQDPDNPREPVTVDGQPASEWLSEMCEGRGIPFSVAHRQLEARRDHGGELPCCQGQPETYDEDEGVFDDGEPAECPAIRQWEELRDLLEHDLLDVVIATHNFAHVPSLRLRTNLVIDEEPDFAQDDLTQDRVRRAVTAYLQEVCENAACEVDARTYEELLHIAHNGLSPNEHDPRDLDQRWDELQTGLYHEPDREWYFEEPDAHTLAPALARAIFNSEERSNGRRVGKTAYDPPRLDASAHEDEDGWNRVWVTVVLDDSNNLRTVRSTPDLSLARSLVGLDAHPARPKWAVNSVPWIESTDVLDQEERRLWRRFERGLRVVQVGDATRPLASGEYFTPQQARALAEHLRSEYGEDFRTAITTKSVEPQLQSILDEVSVHSAEEATMHYGEEKSRNDFALEEVGWLEGCVDPGDEPVLDLIAELDLEAEPEISVDSQGEEHRAHGRGFTGPDDDTAQAILASVRENHVAQAAGRYARNPDDPSSSATVYVRTDAMPPGFADVQVSGVEWTFTDLQRDIVRELRRTHGARTARELAEAVGCSKEHVRGTLQRLVDMGLVDALEDAGTHGATVYADTGVANSGVVDLEDAGANSHVWDSYTWSLAIRDPQQPDLAAPPDPAEGSTSDRQVWDWRSPPD